MPPTKTYFISDFHLGIPDEKASRERELKIIRWLDSVKHDAAEIYLLGDVFDFWYEYKEVIPKGYTRLLGKMAELSDKGITLHYFTGNHDMWVFDYFTKELGIKIYSTPIQRNIHGKIFFIGHGDGLGPGDLKYKFIKKVFASKVCRWLFRWIHPDVGMAVGNYFSRKSRIVTGDYDDIYKGDDNEYLMQFCREKLLKEHIDYFLFGHRHMVIDKMINEKSRYINLGDWIRHFMYAEFDGKELKLLKFE